MININYLNHLYDVNIFLLFLATPKRSRPKSLAISTPTKLLSLEEAQSRVLAAGRPDQEYIEVGE